MASWRIFVSDDADLDTELSAGAMPAPVVADTHIRFAAVFTKGK